MTKNLLSVLIGSVLLGSTMSTTAQTLFLVQEPGSLAGSYDFTDSFSADGWGADLDTTAVTAEAAFPSDGTLADSVCQPIGNPSAVAGKIAVVYRGECNFSLKAYHAQAAGAVGCVIVNNIAGNLVNMLGGDSASAITIPTVFISDIDGAALKDSIIAGGVTIFIGNPNGVFTNNVGAYESHIGRANSSALPSAMAESSSDFSVPIGAWALNYGSDTASNLVVTAVIDRDGTEVYNEVSTGADVAPEDSLFFSLPVYSEDNYTPGFYTITYTLSTDAVDELPVDNELTASFWINEEGYYAKSRVEPNDGALSAGGSRPADGTEFEWCIALESENASALAATGMTFNTVTNDIDLTGQAVQLAVYEWNDPITTAFTFDDLTELTSSEFYDYPSDLQGEFVTHTFSEPIELLDDQKYLACATIFIDDMFLGTDNDIDYNVALTSYPNEAFFPLHDIDGSTWFAGGFGTDVVPALVLNLGLNNGIGEELEALDVTPYPNPTADRINIPFGRLLTGTVLLTAFSADGKLVLSEERCLKGGSNLEVDVTGLSSGMHTFNLVFEDGSDVGFQVVVTK